jgi:hypothetical protein
MPDPITTTTSDERTAVNPLTRFVEDSEPVGLFTRPIDVSLLEQLELDECGRRSRWLPADCLL